MESSLREARIAAGLSIEEVSERLNIRKKYLAALEEGNLDVLPSKVYAEGYLKLYSKFLNLNQNITPYQETHNIIESVQEDNNKQKFFIVAISLLILIIIVILYFTTNI